MAASERVQPSIVAARRLFGVAPDGTMQAVNTDGNGNLDVNVTAGGGINASVGANTSTAPTSSTEIGTIDGSGNLQGVSASNPLPITGTVSASNPSVGTNGATAPTSSTEIGVIDGTGKLQGASSSNPVRIDPVGTTVQPVNGTLTAVTSITNPVTVTGATSTGSAPLGNPIPAAILNAAGNVTAMVGDGGHPTVELVGNNSGLIDGVVNNPYTPIFNTLAGTLNGVNGYIVNMPYMFNGATWDRSRIRTIFKTAQATASGNTAVWTPTSGKKFRVSSLFVEVTDNASLASGAVLTINFQDSTTSINISFDVFVPTTAVTTVIGDGLEQQLDLGPNGILSAAANNVLNVNLSATLSTGNVRIIAMGTEE